MAREQVVSAACEYLGGFDEESRAAMETVAMNMWQDLLSRWFLCIQQRTAWVRWKGGLKHGQLTRADAPA